MKQRKSWKWNRFSPPESPLSSLSHHSSQDSCFECLQQRGLGNFITVQVHVENNWWQRLGSLSCGSFLQHWRSALHLPAAAPLHRTRSSCWEIQLSHVSLWLPVPREVAELLKWCDLKSRKHQMCHFFLVCSAPWMTREANEHEIADAWQELPLQRCWLLFSSLCAPTHHNKFRLGIETSSWKICLGLHNLHADTSSKTLVQGTPQTAAEIEKELELGCDLTCPIQNFDKCVIDGISSFGKVIFNYPSYWCT